ncbi:helix-turn-helix domain-containing protein [Photobacterium minamisatsumaniensis]|uniref:helix-turn-helix domain-containing protein n=1 Tax=Photobacterium minamisatsumaniensis TaxID=2910233 RepID=UPI003D113FDD
MFVFSDFIRNRRLKEGLTQQEFALMLSEASPKLIGVDNVTLSRWEKDQITPTLRRMVQILDALGEGVMGRLLKANLPMRKTVVNNLQRLCLRQFGQFNLPVENANATWITDISDKNSIAYRYRVQLESQVMWGSGEMLLLSQAKVAVLVLNEIPMAYISYVYDKNVLRVLHIAYRDRKSLMSLLRYLAERLDYNSEVLHVFAKVPDPPSRSLFLALGASSCTYKDSLYIERDELLTNLICILSSTLQFE